MPPKSPKPIGEFELIETIRRFAGKPRKPLVLGIGDDCAAWRPAPGRLEIVTTDTLIDGVHFDSSDASPQEIGWKALAANLSDVTAMGGTPLFYLVSLSLPRKWIRTDRVLGLYEGMMDLGKRRRMSLAGGNLTASPQSLIINITVMGDVPARALLRRGDARIGDAVYVTGVPGISTMWLEARRRRTMDPAARELFRIAHYHPNPPVEFSRRASGASGGQRLIHAAIDISDGLAADLGHIVEESGVPGAIIRTGDLPGSFAHLLARSAFGVTDAANLAGFALAGGEDYELLFTAPEANERRLIALGAKLGVRVTKIGEIVRRPGIRTVDASGRELAVSAGGYRHF